MKKLNRKNISVQVNLPCPDNLVRTEMYLKSMHKPSPPCSSEAAKLRQGGTFLFSLLPDMPTRVRRWRVNSVCCFTLVYEFVTQSAWAALGLGWQLLILHFSSKLEVTCKISVTWKRSPAELSGKHLNNAVWLKAWTKVKPCTALSTQVPTHYG